MSTEVSDLQNPSRPEEIAEEESRNPSAADRSSSKDSTHQDKTSDGEEQTETSPEPQADLRDMHSQAEKSIDNVTGEYSSDPKEPNTPTKRLSSPRVSLVTDPGTAPRRVSSGRLRMERELERMRQADDDERLRQKARRQKEVQKAIDAVRKEREEKGVTLTRDVEASRATIRAMMREEERMALAKDQKKLRNETKILQQQIHTKYGMKDKKQGHDLVVLSDSFYHGKVKDKDGLPEHVLRELTRQEIEDLRMVFDMFDLKGRGYITTSDVRRAAGMLGFKAKKDVFSGMIEEVTGHRYGRVSFSLFLQFVVKGQGDGEDPLDAIIQCFRMLDSDQKGYLTAQDLRHAADSQKLSLSNRAIREMIQEADVTGDAKVTSDEFIHVMLLSSMFRTAH